MVADGEEIPVGPDRVLVAVDSPGHAKHHVGLHDSLSGILFAGDAVGVKLPDGGVLRPSTPPPDFDLSQALHSLERFAPVDRRAIALAHYGLLEAPESCWPRPARHCGSGPRRPRPPTAPGPISPTPSPPASSRSRRRRPRPQGEAGHLERRPLERRRLSPLAGRA